MSRSLLERVERLATERFGQGAAVEVGRKSNASITSPRWIYFVKIWNREGREVMIAESAPDGCITNRDGVLRLILDQLQAPYVMAGDAKYD